MKRFVPLKTSKTLSSWQEHKRFDACHKNLQLYEKTPSLLNQVVISDEHLIPVALKSKNKTPKMSKVTVIPFFDQCGLIYTHITPPGLNVNTSYFAEVLKNFRMELNNKRTSSHGKPVPLLLDNATFHNNSLVGHTLKELRLERICHPSYSPDLNPCDYFLFKSLNERLRDGAPLVAGKATNRRIKAELEELLAGDILEMLMVELKLRWMAVCARRLLLESRSLISAEDVQN